MDNNNNTLSGERLSFYKLFSEKKYRISIPIIQRDYAQGRETSSEVRGVFLDALFGYLVEGKPNRDLDFVYGSLNKTNDIIDFVPLDGQQRLTTLFLLHWYLYQISDNEDLKGEFKSVLLKGNKSMFTYDTRTSSSEFCDAFMSNSFDFSKLIDNSISKTIENSSWYFLSWKFDPTIKSMLTMLDAIHDKFAHKKEFFECLIDNENPIITFLFLNLEDFKLTDDLYIKMNSRGKPLTSFENFKAKFEQHLEKETLVRTFELNFKDKVKKVSLKDYFSHNIDTKWANLFWSYRELIGDKDVYDEELKNFIRVIFTNQYAITNINSSEFEFLLGTQAARKRKDYTDNLSYYKYKEVNAINIESILYLVDVLDSLENGNNKLQDHLSLDYQFYYNENLVFENVLRNSFSNNQERILFHAYTRFLIENKEDKSGINQWMRVIHNFSNNTIIDGADEISRAIKSIEKLLSFSKDILSHLNDNPQIDFFASWQVLEEKIKARLILKGQNWKTTIEILEKYDFFSGQIGFALEFSGILNYFENNSNCNWSDQEDQNYLSTFEGYAKKAIAVFTQRESFNNEYIWERAVLTKGDYSLSSRQNSITTINRINLLHTNTGSNNISRDYSWKRLLRITENNSKRNFIKEIFDDKNFNENDIVNSLQKFCNECPTNDWRDYFISNPKLMDYCEKGFIKFDNPNKIFLLSSIYCGANQYFAEMYSYNLWKTHFEPFRGNYPLFENCYYHEVKSIEDFACIILNDFKHNEDVYGINIYYCDDDELPFPYEMAFRILSNDNEVDKFGDDIKEILSDLNFEWNPSYKGYFFSSEESSTLINKLENLHKELEKIAVLTM